MKNRRVLHIITRMIIGGAQENTLLSADFLRKNHWDASILTGPQTGPEGSLLDEVRSRDVPLTIEPTLVRAVSICKDVLNFVRLVRLIKRGGYAVVHTHSSKAGILGRWAARVAGVPVIVHTVHGWGFHEHQPKWVQALYVFLERAALRCTHRLIAVSKHDVQTGIRRGIGSAEDYTVIRSAIDIDSYRRPAGTRERVREELGIPADAQVVGTVTRLSPQKSPLDFVAAAALVSEDLPDTWFVVVGDGPLRGEVETRVDELGLSSRFQFTGLRRDVPDVLQAFDAFLLASLWEGLPRALLQAMAAGVPVVASRLGGNAEVVRDGETGFLVPPGDPRAAAESLRALLTDAGLRARVAGKGREAVTSEFSLTKMCQDIEELYGNLLREHGVA